MIRLSLFVAFFLPLLLWLGSWQLDRAAYKLGLEEQYLERLGALPVNPQAAQLASDEASAFLRVRLQGEFLAERHFLVDNQVHGGVVGYWVVSPFADDSHRIWLVNRGWVAATADRAQLPVIDEPQGVVTLNGLLWPFTGMVPLWRDESSSTQWPRRMQRLDIDAFRQALENDRGLAQDIIPRELRLEPGTTGVFTAAPQVLVGADQTHRGYALTWFGLAAALVIGYLVFWRKQVKETRRTGNPN